jgi:hypothetical protein
MNTLRRWLGWQGVALGLGLAAVSGCQTHVMEAGLTLPSGWYLQHQPQYIPPTPEYPLPRELANLQDASMRPGLPAPAPLVPGGGQ